MLIFLFTRLFLKLSFNGGRWWSLNHNVYVKVVEQAGQKKNSGKKKQKKSNRISKANNMYTLKYLD